MKDKTVAVLTIRRAGDMADEDRRAIAAWLRRQAHFLVADGAIYSDRFVARYNYVQLEDGDGESTAGVSTEDVGPGSVPAGLPEGLPAAE